MKNGGIKCDIRMDGKLIAKEVSPCFMEEFSDDTLFTNYHESADVWYVWGNHSLRMTCTVTADKETSNSERDICGSLLGLDWSFANTNKSIFWYSKSTALRYAA